MGEPKVTIIRGKFILAWDGSPGAITPACPVMTLTDALESLWPGDVYACGYAPAEGVAFRRLAKVAATAYAMDDTLTPPVFGVAFIDVDCPGHAEATDAWVRQQVSLLPADLAQHAGWYATAHGIRFVFIPATPPPLLAANSYLAALNARLISAGIEVDPTSGQWTRLFKLPRAGNADRLRDFSKLSPLRWSPPAGAIVEDEPAAFGAIIHRDSWPSPGRPTKESLKPLAQAGQLGKRLAAELAEERFVVPIGDRHAALLRAANTITAAYDTADPGIAYGLLAGPAMAMGKADMGELQRLCCWAAAAHSGAKAHRAAETVKLTRASADTMACAQVDVSARLVVDNGSAYWVWDESEQEYAGPFTHQHQLHGALLRHCPTLAGANASTTTSVNSVYAACSVAVKKVMYVYDRESAGLDLEASTYRHCDVRVCSDLVPREHKDVGRWLAVLFAADLDRALDWLATFPDLRKAIAALYVDGPPSVGKGMLAMGLARIWSKESAHTAYDAISSTFNGELTTCPLIWADEKVESAAGEANDSSVFRRIVGNTVMVVNEKFQKKAGLVGAPRVLITANNVDAMRIREELTRDDLDAVRLRLGYVRAEGPEAPGAVPPAAMELHQLATEAGYASARQLTEGWVAGGAIAEHVLWLNATRKVVPGHRLWVEGWLSALTERLATSVGSAGPVATAVANAVMGNYSGPAVVVQRGAVYVNSNHLAAHWDRVVGNREDRCPSDNGRLSACRALSDDTNERISRKDVSGKRIQERYWRIPAETLARIAEQRGIASREEFLAQCNPPALVPDCTDTADNADKDAL